jgi:hypothetical protein
MRVLDIYIYNLDYHPVINITMGIPEVLMGTSSVNGRFSIATFDNDNGKYDLHPG